MVGVWYSFLHSSYRHCPTVRVGKTIRQLLSKWAWLAHLSLLCGLTRLSFSFEHERGRFDVLVESIRRVGKTALRIGAIVEFHRDVKHH
jgi:hypothetical protein